MMKSCAIEPCFDPERRLWVPARRLFWQPQIIPALRGLGGFGAVESVPGGISFPTSTDFTKATSYGVEQLTSLTRSEMGLTMTPIGEQASDAFAAVIEGAAGKSLGNLIADAILPDELNSTVASVLIVLISGIVEMVLDSVGEMVADLVGSALDVIPVLGALIKLVIDIIVMIINAAQGSSAEDASDRAQVRAKARNNLNNALNVKCGEAQTFASQVTATGLSADGKSAEVTPGDQFRPIYYQYSKGGGLLPLSPMSLIVMLCGPEADGWAFNEGSYEHFISEARTGQMYEHAEENVYDTNYFGDSAGMKRGGDIGLRVTRFHGRRTTVKTPDPLIRIGSTKGLAPCVAQVDANGVPVADRGLGLRPEIRARMWGLVKAIMSAVQDPSPGAFKRFGDGGRSAMILLTDILFRHYEPIARGMFGDTEGYWSPYLLKCMEHRLATNYRDSKSACIDDICARSTGSCADSVNLTDPMVNFMLAYKEPFLAQFTDENGNFVRKPRLSDKVPMRLRAVIRPATSRLVLTGNNARRFSAAISKTATRSDEKVTTGQKVILATAGVGGSYLAYRGLKAGARLLRARKHRR